MPGVREMEFSEEGADQGSVKRKVHQIAIRKGYLCDDTERRTRKVHPGGR
jgi:hypothetical protein